MFSRRIWLAGLFLSGLWGCGNSPTQPATGDAPATSTTTAAESPAPTSRGTIGVSLLTFENPFFKVIADNIESEGQKHGYETLSLSADNDAAKQSNQIKDFIVRKVVAIVISPRDAKAIVPVIQEANTAGIPVFTVDIPCPDESVKIVSQISTDNYGGGREAAKAMIEALGEAGGDVAILSFKDTQSCILRVNGFRAEVEEYNAKAAHKINIVGEYEGSGKRDVSAAATKDLLQSHDSVKGIFAINDPSALGARAALEQAGKAEAVKLIGFDGQLDGKQAIKEGKIYADPVQFPDLMGVEVVKAIVAHSKGKDVPRENLIPTKLYRKADADQDPSLK